ncbi:hypothetical protein TNCV_4065671 [Trichonephila clavipes]|uniref:Uncharacterized protein n=1 Tax=Trichonephila clavipes TaxID=2585209 RepID=A0A8X7BG14_TRICX|nr:hypothetical protein TNCV_4065671 [Trichonephila clavipes]
MIIQERINFKQVEVLLDSGSNVNMIPKNIISQIKGYYKVEHIKTQTATINGQIKKRASNPRKNIALTAKEIESSSSPNKIPESHTSKMETRNEIKIKQEENLDADEEK